MGYFVYIIQSQADKSLYIGQTNNLQERLLRHNQGRSKYTKPKRPWRPLYYEYFESCSQATKREFELKAFRRKDILLKLIESAS